MRQKSPVHHHHHVVVAPVPNFIDESYNRMKKSCDRIAQVLGLERPSFDRPHVNESFSQAKGLSADVGHPLRQKSPSRERSREMESREGAKFASVSSPANFC